MISACSWIALIAGVFVRLLPAQVATTGHGPESRAQLDGSFETKIYEGQNFQARGDYAAAESYFLDLLRAAEGHESRSLEIAVALDNLGSVLYEEGRYLDAERDYSRAVSILQERLGVENPDYVRVTIHLATTYEACGRYSEAESLLLKALRVTRTATSDQLTESDVLYDLGRMNIITGRYSQAAEFFSEALEIFRTTQQAFEPRFETRAERIATTLSDLACAHARLGQISGAVAEAESAQRILEGLPHAPPRTAVKVLTVLAYLYATSGRAQAAEPLMKRALALAEFSYGRAHPSLAPVLDVYATAERQLHRKREARSMETRARLIRTNSGINSYSELTVSIQSLLPGASAKK